MTINNANDKGVGRDIGVLRRLEYNGGGACTAGRGVPHKRGMEEMIDGMLTGSVGSISENGALHKEVLMLSKIVPKRSGVWR